MTPKWQHIWWAVRHYPSTGLMLLWIEIQTALEPRWFALWQLKRLSRRRA